MPSPYELTHDDSVFAHPLSRALQTSKVSITKYYKVAQSITKANLAHLLGPIFGLVCHELESVAKYAFFGVILLPQKLWSRIFFLTNIMYVARSTQDTFLPKIK